MLRNPNRLRESMPASRVIVHTVDVRQLLGALRAFVTGKGLRHLIQQLQRKEDYRQFYSTAVTAPDHSRTGPRMHLRRSQMRYFNIDGVETPCCFIKDTSSRQGVQALYDELAMRCVPEFLGVRRQGSLSTW